MRSKRLRVSIEFSKCSSAYSSYYRIRCEDSGSLWNLTMNPWWDVGDSIQSKEHNTSSNKFMLHVENQTETSKELSRILKSFVINKLFLSLSCLSEKSPFRCCTVPTKKAFMFQTKLSANIIKYKIASLIFLPPSRKFTSAKPAHSLCRMKILAQWIVKCKLTGSGTSAWKHFVLSWMRTSTP